jgi:hypothetical protein
MKLFVVIIFSRKFLNSDDVSIYLHGKAVCLHGDMLNFPTDVCHIIKPINTSKLFYIRKLSNWRLFSECGSFHTKVGSKEKNCSNMNWIKQIQSILNSGI